MDTIDDNYRYMPKDTNDKILGKYTDEELKAMQRLSMKNIKHHARMLTRAQQSYDNYRDQLWYRKNPEHKG